MKTIKIRAHHAEEVLGWLLMPELRTGLIDGLYSIKQRDYAQKVVEAYSNKELKFIEIVNGIDDICDRCKKKCNKEENQLVLNEKIFNFKRYPITSLIKEFDKNRFYWKLYSDAHMS